MKRKYNKEFGLFRYLYLPFNKFIILLSKPIFLFINLFLQSDKDIRISKFKIKYKKKDIKIYKFENKNHIDNKKSIIYLHGGGFAFKGYISHFNLCKKIVKETGYNLYYIEYSLLPKYTYPYAVEECYFAYINLYKKFIHQEKIILMGDSAGGNLTIELTNKLIQNKEKIPVSILLLYPVIDDKINTLSKTEFVNTPMWNSKNNEKMWKYYLKDKKYISPFTFCTLNKFPSTYIEVCEFDPLKDEGVEFANVLKNKGVDVILNETKDTLHGFDISPTSMTKKAFIERIKFINKI